METVIEWLQTLAEGNHIETLSIVVTAVGTILLAIVTWVLARETKVLSRATSQAQVTVTLEPNQWAVNHVDLFVANSGNAVAYDIDILFDPPLPSQADGASHRRELSLPLQKISILRPSQTLQSNLCQFSAVSKKTYEVTVTWRHQPGSKRRERLSYQLSMMDYEGVSFLGARNPLTQIAEQIKKLREDWQNVAAGRRRVEADVFSAADRDKEHEDRRRIYEDMRAEQSDDPSTEALPDGEPPVS